MGRKTENVQWFSVSSRLSLSCGGIARSWIRDHIFENTITFCIKKGSPNFRFVRVYCLQKVYFARVSIRRLGHTRGRNCKENLTDWQHRVVKMNETDSVPLAEYEFERLFDEKVAFQWMEDNWWVIIQTIGGNYLTTSCLIEEKPPPELKN